MRHLKVLWHIIKVTKFSYFVSSFITYILIASFILSNVEPSINSFWDGLWYSMVSSTTLGYGDIIVTTFIGRIVSIFLALYGLIFFGCLSGIMVAYYTEMNKSHNMKGNEGYKGIEK